ncbi:DapH/DapD/GlmU-related protein, partial [Bradyrhizobium sp.]
VTVGSVEDGRGLPRIGDHVDIGAGAKILGPVSIGSHARIGANAVITRDVDAGSTAFGVNQSKQSQGGREP